MEIAEAEKYLLDRPKSIKNKKLIIEMAESGKDKPKLREGGKTNKLGACLNNYASKSSVVYDPIFIDTIKKLRPDWYSGPLNVPKKSIDNKIELLKMAKNGLERPKDKKLNNALRRYTSSANKSFDLEFNNEIKELCPDWFVCPKEKFKKDVLNYAKIADSKLSKKQQMKLWLYVSTKGKFYDVKFAEKIRKLRPDWFFGVTKRNKKILLEMANSGADQPDPTTKIGRAFIKYTGKYRYRDSKFTEKIKELRPDWFRE